MRSGLPSLFYAKSWTMRGVRAWVGALPLHAERTRYASRRAERIRGIAPRSRIRRARRSLERIRDVSRNGGGAVAEADSSRRFRSGRAFPQKGQVAVRLGNKDTHRATAASSTTPIIGWRLAPNRVFSDDDSGSRRRPRSAERAAHLDGQGRTDQEAHR
jgi:hypothetical protein